MVSDLLLIAGAALSCLGLGLIWPPLGVVALGLFLIVAGVGSYRPPKQPQE